jgi:recombination protein RecR
MYPYAILKKIIEDFQKLPGIGEKTAERLALHLVTQIDQDELSDFQKHILDTLKTEIKFCQMSYDYRSRCLSDLSINIEITKHYGRRRCKRCICYGKNENISRVYHVLGGLLIFQEVLQIKI